MHVGRGSYPYRATRYRLKEYGGRNYSTNNKELFNLRHSRLRVTVDRVLTVNSCIKVRLDLQADKSPVVVKGPFFPRVVNPRYRIRGTMCNATIQSSKARKSIL
jgi:hypothetical protein